MQQSAATSGINPTTIQSNGHPQQPQSTSPTVSSMEHTTSATSSSNGNNITSRTNNNNNNSNNNNNNMKQQNLDAVVVQAASPIHAQHFNNNTSSQQPITVTTTAAPVVITVANAPSTPSGAEMISSQPVVVQVSNSANQYIAVNSAAHQQQQASSQQPQSTTTNHTTQIKLDETDAETTVTHHTYEDYNVYPNGSNSTGHMAYYLTESYGPTTYYNTNIPDTAYVLMEQAPPPPTGSGGEQQQQQQQAAQIQTATTASITNNGAIHISAAHTAAGAHPHSQQHHHQHHHRDTTQQNMMPSEEDYNNSNKSYQTSTRLSVQPQTVNWLNQNYETADGVSLPRSTLYSHYQQHCQQNHIEPVNAASFGKLIRSVFVGLRTRRLGTRGNSKYHYYGIRLKADSVLNDSQNGAIENNTMPPVKRSKVNNINKNNATNDLQHANVNMVNTSKENLQSYLGDVQNIFETVWPKNQQQQFSLSSSTSSSLSTSSNNSNNNNNQTIDTANNNDTEFKSDTNQSQEDSQMDTEDETQKTINVFMKNYRTHYDKIIQALSELSFLEVENIWMSFWQPIATTTTTANDPKNGEEELSIECLKDLTQTNLVAWISETDYTMYNIILTNLLLPNLLKPIPQVLTQQLRNFAKCINRWMVAALHGYSEEFIRIKTSAVSALSHMLRRYTSLNHLATAACAVLKNQQQVSQMINDLNKVDFKNVQEQASWVCQCDEELVHQIEDSFKKFLQEVNPSEQWPLWCEKVLDMSLESHQSPNNNNNNNTSNDNSITNPNNSAARQFFFKWGFYSSLVMRDLTLRSAQSFGSFHLIRLLLDEYIFYLVEQRIAKDNGTTALQMLGDVVL